MSASDPEYVTIGQILAHWGINGKIKVAPTTDFPQRFSPSSKVYINRRPMSIESAEWHKGKAIIKLNDVNNAEAAQKLRGKSLEIHRSQLNPLPAGQYYLFQIIGLEVWTTGEERLGTVTEVQTASSNDTYIVSGDGEEFLIPAIEDVIKSIDLERGRVVIEPIEGLLTLNSKSPKRTAAKAEDQALRKTKKPHN